MDPALVFLPTIPMLLVVHGIQTHDDLEGVDVCRVSVMVRYRYVK